MNLPGMPIPFGTVLVLASLVAGPLSVPAQEIPPQVTKLHSNKTELVDCQDRTKKKIYVEKDEFLEPWPIVANPPIAPPKGYLVVIVKGKEYCVRAKSVETNIKTVGKGLIDQKDRGGAASGRK